MNLFSKEFFPTPAPVIETMLCGVNLKGKTVLEPSAGKGDIIDVCKLRGANVIACELHDDLRAILHNKCYVIANDFLSLTAEQISHVDYIIMNPPFSVADKHILHAWNVAPEGCEIISLCNSSTLENNYSRSRTELLTVVRDYGDEQKLGDCFAESERTTDVQVSMLKLYKPIITDTSKLEGFSLEMDENPGENGLMAYDEVRAIVGSYIGCVKSFDIFHEAATTFNRLSSFGNAIIEIGHDKRTLSKDEFLKELQKRNWKKIFDKVNIGRYVTKGVMADINKFVEQQSRYPFTVKNVYRMLEIIVGTREQTMSRAIAEAVDNFTKYTDENRYNVEGWKTNAGHMLNKKFISGWICEKNWSGGTLSVKTWQGNFEYLTDLTKAICFLTGRKYDEIESINGANYNNGNFTPNTWYTWGFFRFKLFKKGTGHFEFLDEKVWNKLNAAYAKIKGQVLPENIHQTRKQAA